MEIRINEAIKAYKERTGKTLFKKDIAARLFPEVNKESQTINMSNLCTGRTKRICPEWVVIICEMCECSADFLFGIENEDYYEEEY